MPKGKKKCVYESSPRDVGGQQSILAFDDQGDNMILDVQAFHEAVILQHGGVASHFVEPLASEQRDSSFTSPLQCSPRCT